MAFPIVVAAHGFKQWAVSLGGPGLIIVGILDNSFVPLPGSLDVFTILLVSTRHDLWPYYVSMSVIGSVAGGYITYRIGEKGGEEVLERRIGKQRSQKVYARFRKGGFLTVTLGAMMPPPFPMVPVLVAAGVLQYPRKNFLGALALGRGVRFTADAMLGIFFGRAILGFFSQYYEPALYTLIALGVAGGIGTFVYFKYWRPRKQKEKIVPEDTHKAA